MATIKSSTVKQDFEEYVGDTLTMKFNWVAGASVYSDVDLSNAVITNGVVISGVDSVYIGGKAYGNPTLQTAVVITGTQVNLTGYTARMHVKAAIDDVTPLQIGTVTLGGSTNNVICELSNAQTTELGAGKFVYDIEITDTLGKVNTFAIGKIKLKLSATI